jgi:hypothetical protein
MLCLVVEYTGEDSEFPAFTRAHRGATVDLMVEPGETLRRQALVLVRDAAWAAVQALVADLSTRRAPVTTLRAEPAEELWFGRVSYDPRALDHPTARAVASLLDLVGPPWVHVESGVVHLRARLRDPAQAEDVLHLAEEGLKAAGTEAQVVVQEVSTKDHSVWESLVRHGIGLSA